MDNQDIPVINGGYEDDNVFGETIEALAAAGDIDGFRALVLSLRDKLRTVTHERDEILIDKSSITDKYNELFEQMHTTPCGYLLLERDGRITSANAFGASLFASEAGHLHDRNIADFIVPADIALFEQFLGKVFSEDMRQTIEVRVFCDSHEKHYSFTATAAANGTRCHLVIIDITPRKWWEEYLRTNEERFRSYVENANDFIYLLTDKGVCTYISPNWTEATGFEIRDVIGIPFGKFIHPEDITSFYDLLQKTFLTGQKQKGIEYRIMQKNGEWRWHTTNSAPFRNKDGEVSLFLGISHDITDLKLALETSMRNEREYRRTKEFLQCVIDNIPSPLAVKDRNHRWILVNRIISDIFGKPMSELIGKTDHDFIKKSETDIFRQKEIEVFTTGLPNINEEVITVSNGHKRWQIAEKRLFFDSEGTQYLLAIAYDITERKQLERENERMLAELVSKNAELEAFGYTISHELKGPLAVISASTAMIERKLADSLRDEGLPHIRRINDNINKMIRLIDVILDYSRIGHDKNRNLPIDFRTIIDEILRQYETEIAHKGITIDIGDFPSGFTGEPERVRQLFDNLISNAIKYTNPDNPSPHIEIGTEDIDGKTVFFVSDNGIGIAPGNHARVFEVFQRLHNDSACKGSGIGLSIVKRIVGLFGGTIWIKSSTGNGASFRFTLGA